jgi:hypothetical protein
MTPLSPGAQSVFDAAYKAWVTQDDAASIAAATLRAAADQVISSVPPPCADFDEHAKGFLAAHVKYRRQLLAIAAELVEQLRCWQIDGAWIDQAAQSRLIDRARAALAQPEPVAVSERLPEPSVKVLAHYFNDLGKGRTICAIWVPAKSRSDEGDLDADGFLEYDEESDTYYWPEGWYEAIENWEELGWAKVYEGEIAYWQPLPQWPANALPIPREH